MQTQERLVHLIEELGPAAEIVNGVESIDEGLWGVSCLDDQVAVVVEFDDARESLTLQTEHAAPSEANRLRTYETLLQYNAMAHDTGGIRMGLVADEGVVLQECDLSAVNLDLRELQAALENFVAKAIVWQGVLSGGGVTEQAPQVADPTDAAGIRV